MISLIVSAALNNVIGKDGQIPWKLPEDKLMFKKLTLGHTVIIGRKTFETIKKELPGRTVIVLTRGNGKIRHSKEVFIAGSPEEALQLAGSDPEIFIAGGQQIYELFFAQADRIYLTRILKEFEGDSFFPKPDPRTWTLLTQTPKQTDTASGLKHILFIYQKNQQQG